MRARPQRQKQVVHSKTTGTYNLQSSKCFLQLIGVQDISHITDSSLLHNPLLMTKPL